MWLQNSRTLVSLAIAFCISFSTSIAQEDGNWTRNIGRQLSESVFTVYQYNTENELIGQGAAFCVGEEGLIATCLHVIGEARAVKIGLPDGSRHEITEVVSYSKDWDLAVVRISQQGLSPLPLATGENTLQRGEEVATMGNPNGSNRSLVQGIVGIPAERLEGVNRIHVNIPVDYGNSGGPLVDRFGRVHGVMHAKSATMMNLGYAVGINHLRELLTNPDPISIGKWLKINSLPDDRWKASPSHLWHRRGGRIECQSGPADVTEESRSCEWLGPIPTVPFHVAVDMKLGAESGTAGLMLRMPAKNNTVWAWVPIGQEMVLLENSSDPPSEYHVLGRVRTEHFQRSGWNKLSMEVHEDHIRCFLNNREVFSYTWENSLFHHQSPGTGLSVLQHHNVSFKNFALWKASGPMSSDPAMVDFSAESIAAAQQGRNLDSRKLEAVPGSNDTRLQLILQKHREHEAAALQLHQLARYTKEQIITRDLLKLLQKPDADIPLVQAALTVSGLENPSLQPRIYEHQSEELVRDVEQALPANATPTTKAHVLRDVLYKRHDMHVARFLRADRHIPLTDVRGIFEDHEGGVLPLTLLIIDLGRRIGLDVQATYLSGFLKLNTQEEGAPVELLHVCDGAIANISTFQESSHCLSSHCEEEIRMLLKTIPNRLLVLAYLNDLKNELTLDQWPENALPYLRTLQRLAPESIQTKIELALVEIVKNPSHQSKADLLNLLHQSDPKSLDTNRMSLILQAMKVGSSITGPTRAPLPES